MKNTTVVDSNFSVVPVYFLGEKNEEREYTDKTITHYTNINSLSSILETKTFLAKTLIYKSQKESIPNIDDLVGQIFLISFTNNLVENELMWENVKRNCNCKVDFFFQNNAYDLIDTSRYFALYKDIDDEPIELFKHLKCTNHHLIPTKEIFVSTKFISQNYVTDKEAKEMKMLKNNEEVFACDDKMFDIIGHTATHELDKWDYQNEVKMILKLMSTNPVEISKCKILSCPIKFDNVTELKVTLKMPYSKSELERLEMIIKNLGLKYQFLNSNIE